MGSSNYKLSENPPELPFPMEELDGPWLVVHTRSRSEKLLAHFLLSHNIPFFLPLIPSLNDQGHPTGSLIPLFPGILFLTTPKEDPTEFGLQHSKDIAIQSSKVFSFLHTRSKASQQTLRSELSLLSLESSNNRTLENFNWSSPNDRLLGRFVEIVTPHACAGLRGHLIEIKNKQRFVIQLSFLGRPTSMEIDSKVLRPLSQNLKHPNQHQRNQDSKVLQLQGV